MAPPSALQRSAASPEIEPSLRQPLVHSSTLPASHQNHRADPSHLAPEDAFYATSPPRRASSALENGSNASGNELHPNRRGRKNGSRSRSRRRKRFQKLLWVKQSYPDNYTDEATFLANLQRNPRVQPYDFWPLVADSTVIMQHVCSVIIFIVCFVGIFQERLSPVSVVGWGSLATFLGWLLWEWWVGQGGNGAAFEPPVRARHVGTGAGRRELRPQARQESSPRLGIPNNSRSNGPPPSSVSSLPPDAGSAPNSAPAAGSPQDSTHPTRRPTRGCHSGASHYSAPAQATHNHSPPVSSATSQTSNSPPARSGPGTDTTGPHEHSPALPSRHVSHAHPRLSTIKSAVLIYSTLLALSPILKSLTRSTSSDSIWAMSFWLLAINIFFFDYAGFRPGVNKFPVASLSTNAALMASTVLASRLPSTGQVFSLTLFSIEVFGLFPVFRGYARHRSWRFHFTLTVLLVLGAGAGVGMILGADEGWPWRRGLLGMLVGCLIAAIAMGGCSWWLIGLQKYKNEIYGPWDPARPIIISRRHWEDD